MILAAIGGHYGWPRADLDGLTAAEAIFWNNAAAEYLRRAQEQS